MKLHQFLITCLSAGLIFGTQAAHSEIISFCVENKAQLTECRRFRAIPPLNAKCGSGATDCVHLDCVQSENCTASLLSEEADVIMASPFGLYYMNNASPGAFQPVVREHRGGDLSFSSDPSESGLGYNVLAVVNKETCDGQSSFTLESTQGFASCHGDYGSMAGWVTAVIELQDNQLSSGDSDIDIVQKFYTSSCAPANNDKKLCTACAQTNQCTLDDEYAGSVGTLRCIRAGTPDAPRIGFVDHLTALGAGQNDSFVPEDGNLVGSFKDSEASKQNADDFRAVCRSGVCRGLRQAAQSEECFLEEVPADVAVMRASDQRVALVRRQLVAASSKKAFRDLFGTTGNVQGALFSHGTHELRAEEGATDAYIGAKLISTLSQYDTLFTVTPQTDAPTGSSDSSDSGDDTNIGRAVGLSFVAALLVGLLLGACCLWFVCRRRMRKDTGAQASDPYVHKDPVFDGTQSTNTTSQPGTVLMDEA
eukprot:jgi/Ulvmu1/12071/UM083_0084.1